MSEKRFTDTNDGIYDNQEKRLYKISAYEFFECETDEVVDLLNELHEENMDLRAKHTQMIIIMKDVVKDLKRIDTYRYAEHLEKIANLHFLSEKELEDE